MQRVEAKVPPGQRYDHVLTATNRKESDHMETSWKPDRKIVAGAIAGLVTGVLQYWVGVEVFPGLEAGIAVLVAYFVPSTKSKPLDS